MNKNNKIYGYLRISTNKQCINNCKKEILLKANNLNLNNDIEWIEETISGTKHFKKRKLGELVNKCNKNDIIITSELSRIGRKIKDIMEFLALISQKKVKLYMTKTDFKIDDSIESQVLIFAYALSAQIERQLISSRTISALARAKENGVTLGRKYGSKGKLKLYPHIEDIKKLLNDGVKKNMMAKKYNVNNNTITNFIKRYNL